MANILKTDNCVYVEYCRACNTHSWCTHHDEAKYHDTFLKLAELIGKELPGLQVVGNMVPQHLLPFKISQNKYVDARTNKYVMYPSMGAFEVKFNGELLFSKKTSNTWPNFYDLLTQINRKVNGEQSQLVNILPKPSVKKEKEVFKAVEAAHSDYGEHFHQEFSEKTDRKQSPMRDKASNFTLTDHFKLYKSKNKNTNKTVSAYSEEDVPTGRSQSDLDLVNPKQNQSNLQTENKIRAALCNKGWLTKEGGKKEMIFRLDSIEEESMLVEDKSPEQTQARSWSKNHKLREFDNDLSELEHKLKNFEEKVITIQKKNKEFEHKMPPIDQKTNKRRINDGEEGRETIKAKQETLSLSRNKAKEVESYIYASEEEKNEKLHRIYGQWNLLKNSRKAQHKLTNKSKKSANRPRNNIDQDDSSSDYASNSSQSQSKQFLKTNNDLRGKKRIRNSNLPRVTQDKQNSDKITEVNYSQSDKRDQAHSQDNFFKKKTDHVQKQANTKCENGQQLKSLTATGRLLAKNNTQSTGDLLPRDAHSPGEHKQSSEDQFESYHKFEKKAQRFTQGAQPQKQDKGAHKSVQSCENSKRSEVSHRYFKTPNRINKTQINTMEMELSGNHSKTAPNKNMFNKDSNQKLFGTINHPLKRINRNKKLKKQHGNQKQTTTRTDKTDSNEFDESTILHHDQKKSSLGRIRKNKMIQDQVQQAESKKGSENDNEDDLQISLSPKIKNKDLHNLSNEQDGQKTQKRKHRKQSSQKMKTQSRESQPRPASEDESKIEEIQMGDCRANSEKDCGNSEANQGYESEQSSLEQFSIPQSEIQNEVIQQNKRERKQSQKREQFKCSKQTESIFRDSKGNMVKDFQLAEEEGDNENCFKEEDISEYNCMELEEETPDETPQEEISNEALSEHQRISTEQRSLKKEGKRKKIVSNKTKLQQSHNNNSDENSQLGEQKEKQSLKKLHYRVEEEGSQTEEIHNENGQGYKTQTLEEDQNKSVKLKIVIKKPQTRQCEQICGQQQKGQQTQKVQPALEGLREGQKNDRQRDPNTKLDQGGKKLTNISTENNKEYSVISGQNIDQFGKTITEGQNNPEKTEVGNYLRKLSRKIGSFQSKINEENEDQLTEINRLTEQSTVSEEQQKVTDEVCQEMKHSDRKQITIANTTLNETFKGQPISVVSAHCDPITRKSQSKTNLKVYHNSQSSQLIDNVDCQSKPRNTNLCQQVGVQKNLTFDISIQTGNLDGMDSFISTAFEPLDSNIINLPQKSTVFKTSERNQDFQKKPSHKLNSFNMRQQAGKKPKRAPILQQIYGSHVDQQSQKYEKIINQQLSSEQLAKLTLFEDNTAKKKSLRDIYDYNTTIFSNDSLLIQQVQSNQIYFSSLRKIVQILAHRNEYLITRLFQCASGSRIQPCYGVWICNNYRWECVVVDDFVRVDNNGLPIATFHQNGLLWIHILEKALAKVLGGYDALLKTECHELFTMLTGSNSLYFVLKDEITKNWRFLKYVQQSRNKNFIVHSERLASNAAYSNGKISIYYILAQKVVNDEEILLEICENDKPSVWIKMSKFVQEFKTAEILQLRMNHNFTNVDLTQAAQNQMTIIALEFERQSFGCITLAYLEGTGPLKAYLYKEEREHLLKLVGEAKQKKKHQLFFDCCFTETKYYIFAQYQGTSCRMAYFGDSKPTITPTEKIQIDGLKNDFTEYLPVKHFNERKENEFMMPRQIKKRHFNETGLSYDSKVNNEDDNLSRMKETFVQFLLNDLKSTNGGKGRRLQF